MELDTGSIMNSLLMQKIRLTKTYYLDLQSTTSRKRSLNIYSGHSTWNHIHAHCNEDECIDNNHPTRQYPQDSRAQESDSLSIQQSSRQNPQDTLATYKRKSVITQVFTR